MVVRRNGRTAVGPFGQTSGRLAERLFGSGFEKISDVSAVVCPRVGWRRLEEYLDISGQKLIWYQPINMVGIDFRELPAHCGTSNSFQATLVQHPTNAMFFQATIVCSFSSIFAAAAAAASGPG